MIFWLRGILKKYRVYIKDIREMFSLVIRESYTKNSTRNRQYSRRERPKVASKISSIVDEKKNAKDDEDTTNTRNNLWCWSCFKKRIVEPKKIHSIFFSPSLPNRLGLCVSIDDDFCRYFWVPFRNGRSHRNIPPKKRKDWMKRDLSWREMAHKPDPAACENNSICC